MSLFTKILLIFTAVLVAVLLFFEKPLPDDPKLKADAKAPLLCYNKTQCDAYWQRARVWIVQNSKHSIESESDTVIQTQESIPIQKRKKTSYRVFKTGSLDGWTAIGIEVKCPNLFGCNPTEEELTASFKRFVRQQ
jgi:hypothetical protein